MFEMLKFIENPGLHPRELCLKRVYFIGYSQSKEKQVPVTVSMWSPEQQAIASPLAKAIREGITSGVPAYPGELSVARTPEEEAYFSSTAGLADWLDVARARLGLPAYEITPETTEQYFAKSIKEPMLKDWREIVEPQIRESFAGPGYWGSARAQAQVKGATDLATELGAKRAELYYQDELARRAALESAAAREAMYGPTYATTGAEVLGTAGQYARQIEQEELLADFSRWLSGETVEGIEPTMYNPFIQLAFSYLGLEPYALGTYGKASSMGFSLGASA